MATILVTGGAGFIGSHLVDRLWRDGATVRVLDDLSSGLLENLSGPREFERERFRFTLGSVTDRDALDEAAAGCDWIFHLAAVVGVRRVVEEPVEAQRNLLHGTEAVLECARRNGCGVLLASSSEVYGKGVRIPFHEDDDLRLGSPAHARWGYGAAKAMGEFLAKSYADTYDVPVIVTRFFNTVGPRQNGRFGMVVPRFVRQALGGAPITVYGDGAQQRCFTDVRDTVECLVRLWQCPEAIGEIVNIGNDREITILDLARRVLGACDSDSEIRCVAYDQVFPAGFEDVRRRVPDVTRLEQLTGYRPARDLDETLGWIVADARARLDRAASVTGSRA